MVRIHPSWSFTQIASRSLFPLMAIALLASSMWIGPWLLLLLTFVWWRLVTVVG